MWKSFDEVIQCTETLIQAELYVDKSLYNFQKTTAFCGADSVRSQRPVERPKIRQF